MFCTFCSIDAVFSECDGFIFDSALFVVCLLRFLAAGTTGKIVGFKTLETLFPKTSGRKIFLAMVGHFSHWFVFK